MFGARFGVKSISGSCFVRAPGKVGNLESGGVAVSTGRGNDCAGRSVE
jgi:hypothetical protein